MKTRNLQFTQEELDALHAILSYDICVRNLRDGEGWDKSDAQRVVNTLYNKVVSLPTQD